MFLPLMLFGHAVQHATAIWVLAFTPADSVIRPALLPLVLFITLWTLLLNDAITHPVVHGLINFNTVGVLFQYIDCACISRWSFAAGGPTSRAGGHRKVNLEDVGRSTAGGKTWSKIRFGTSLITTWRAAGTPWEVKGTPQFNSLPGRTHFVMKTLLGLAIDLLILDAMSQVQGGGVDENTVKYAWDKVQLLSRLRTVSQEEIVTRLQALLGFWLGTFLSIRAMHRTLAIVGVVTGLKDVRRWPPIFGSLGQTYTLRRFWGVFWHQSLRQKSGSPAFYITHCILRLEKGGRTARYCHLFLTYIMSASIHLMAEEYPWGIAWSRSGTLTFFITNAFGILIEDLVQTSFMVDRCWWTTAVGWVWVGLFIFWSSPAHFYPRMQVLDSSQGGVPPVSILKPLMTYFAAP